VVRKNAAYENVSIRFNLLNFTNACHSLSATYVKAKDYLKKSLQSLTSDKTLSEGKEGKKQKMFSSPEVNGATHSRYPSDPPNPLSPFLG
jgi:hypothetical protein